MASRVAYSCTAPGRLQDVPRQRHAVLQQQAVLAYSCSRDSPQGLQL